MQHSVSPLLYLKTRVNLTNMKIFSNTYLDLVTGKLDEAKLEFNTF